MADREDNVYRAKLAEQAERYDGILSVRALFWFFFSQNLLLADPSSGRRIYGNLMCLLCRQVETSICFSGMVSYRFNGFVQCTLFIAIALGGTDD